MKYFVFSGYVSPDSYDCCEGNMPYNITEYNSKEEVLNFKKFFDEEISGECNNIIFRIFKGEELNIVEEEIIIKKIYTLKKKE